MSLINESRREGSSNRVSFLRVRRKRLLLRLSYFTSLFKRVKHVCQATVSVIVWWWWTFFDRCWTVLDARVFKRIRQPPWNMLQLSGLMLAASCEEVILIAENAKRCRMKSLNWVKPHPTPFNKFNRCSNALTMLCPTMLDNMFDRLNVTIIFSFIALYNTPYSVSSKI